MTMIDDDITYTEPSPFHDQAAANGEVTWNVDPVIFEPLRDFLKRDLPKSEALVGTERNGTNLLPRYGWVMPWGREGSGKTSVLVDLLYHAACGRPWLNYAIHRPIRFVVIINEGVPGGLQDKLKQKLELWDGDTNAVQDNIAIYASPWGEFTFSDIRMREHARDYAIDFQADYVAADPLHTLGTTGAGTPQETEEFKRLLRGFGLWQDLGILTAHHSNKNGMVSGDWARHPDTVIRLEKDGKNPATKITLEKARPADPHELGVPVLLEWITETLGYKRVAIDTAKATDDDMLAGIYKALSESDAALTMTYLRAAVTGDDTRIGELAQTEIAAGRISNESTRKNTYRLRVTSDNPTLWTGSQTRLGESPETNVQNESVTPATDSTDNASTDELNRTTEPNGVCEPHSQTLTDVNALPDDGGESVNLPSPLRGEEDTENDDGAQTDGPEDAGPTAAVLASDDIDWNAP